MIHPHVLHIDLILSQLDEEELSKFSNGMGSGLPLLRIFTLPKYYQQLFENAVLFHDVGYFVGGTRFDQVVVDQEFYDRCLGLARLAPGYLRSKFWARLAYYAVTLGGSISFERLARPRTLEEMKAYAKLRPEF
jgi:hypothetical protein